MSDIGGRVQPVDATPSNLARGGGVRWRGLHGYGSRRSRGLSFGSAGRTVNVWQFGSRAPPFCRDAQRVSARKPASAC
jgi:hypothetical protein